MNSTILNSINCIISFLNFLGTNNSPLINKARLQQEDLIFLEILEQFFSKLYHKMLYIFLKFI